MSWYWIVLIVFVYPVGWGATIAIMEREWGYPELGAVIGSLWPMLIPLYLGWKIFHKREEKK